MNTTITNFIPVNRKIFRHEFWLQKRSFSRFEAWLDLLATARFDNSEGKVMLNGSLIKFYRGELVASVRFLMDRWTWTKNKVDTFLKLLKSEGMITTRTADRAKQTIITICNYENYNFLGSIAGQKPDNDRTLTGQIPHKANTEDTEQKSKEREVYRSFAHLTLYRHEYLQLLDLGYTQNQINDTLDAIENFRHNKKYTSLFFTLKKWLPRQNFKSAPAAGRVTNIASAFQQALQY